MGDFQAWKAQYLEHLALQEGVVLESLVHQTAASKSGPTTPPPSLDPGGWTSNVHQELAEARDRLWASEERMRRLQQEVEQEQEVRQRLLNEDFFANKHAAWVAEQQAEQLAAWQARQQEEEEAAVALSELQAIGEQMRQFEEEKQARQIQEEQELARAEAEQVKRQKVKAEEDQERVARNQEVEASMMSKAENMMKAINEEQQSLKHSEQQAQVWKDAYMSNMARIRNQEREERLWSESASRAKVRLEGAMERLAAERDWANRALQENEAAAEREQRMLQEEKEAARIKAEAEARWEEEWLEQKKKEAEAMQKTMDEWKRRSAMTDDQWRAERSSPSLAGSVPKAAPQSVPVTLTPGPGSSSAGDGGGWQHYDQSSWADAGSCTGTSSSSTWRPWSESDNGYGTCNFCGHKTYVNLSSWRRSPKCQACQRPSCSGYRGKTG